MHVLRYRIILQIHVQMIACSAVNYIGEEAPHFAPFLSLTKSHLESEIDMNGFDLGVAASQA